MEQAWTRLCYVGQMDIQLGWQLFWWQCVCYCGRSVFVLLWFCSSGHILCYSVFMFIVFYMFYIVVGKY